MRKALIADIQRTSFHDGYGIRTTVFFKGCPLSCAWCHNPECLSDKIQTLFYPEKCIGCGKCDEGCFSGARAVCGKEYTIDELLCELSQDKEYFANGGGITFSGGEPMMQKEFVSELCDKCSAIGIGCAIETSLVYFDETLFRKMDFVMADLKVWDTDIHREYIGIENDVIKENFIKLNRLGIPIIARTPIIPELYQGIDKISFFLKDLENVVKYELLPYHPLGLQKAKALKLTQKKFTIPSKEHMEELQKYVFVREQTCANAQYKNTSHS